MSHVSAQGLHACTHFRGSSRPDPVTEYSEANPNVAIHGRLIISTGMDGYVFALDAATGRLAWETQILDYRSRRDPTRQQRRLASHVSQGYHAHELHNDTDSRGFKGCEATQARLQAKSLPDTPSHQKLAPGNSRPFPFARKPAARVFVWIVHDWTDVQPGRSHHADPKVDFGIFSECPVPIHDFQSSETTDRKVPNSIRRLRPVEVVAQAKQGSRGEAGTVAGPTGAAEHDAWPTVQECRANLYFRGKAGLCVNRGTGCCLNEHRGHAANQVSPRTLRSSWRNALRGLCSPGRPERNVSGSIGQKHSSVSGDSQIGWCLDTVILMSADTELSPLWVAASLMNRCNPTQSDRSSEC